MQANAAELPRSMRIDRAEDAQHVVQFAGSTRQIIAARMATDILRKWAGHRMARCDRQASSRKGHSKEAGSGNGATGRVT